MHDAVTGSEVPAELPPFQTRRQPLSPWSVDFYDLDTGVTQAERFSERWVPRVARALHDFAVFPLRWDHPLSSTVDQTYTMPVVKGGVWTNIEDEVLKAAISKYGLNQWARVSSLLARKTPKQCKARWSEWLDPGIRKVEWSREEDERLLHLAKIMPTQWRTIAPIVGRTATQCLERYQRLLDEAEAREGNEFGLGGPAGGETAAPSADDVRRLRPGELDPDPESKPARPDTIDMDEDEKEMLSEARARLANTQGKKAKRKARERQLEESRRLALLQKRRELKNAGINTKINYRKKGQMDYNADIPFERMPAAGFYDTTEETERNEKQRAAFDPKKQQLANKRKPDEEEGKDRKKKRTEDKQDGPSAAAVRAAQLQKLRDAERDSNRRALNLPAPQVSETELEDIVKMGMAGERATKLAGSGDNNATRGMVGSYSTIQQTPIRTPRAPPQDDRIANEIKNIRALTETKSSLLGGENTELIEGSGSTGFDGATPRQHTLATPNPMTTPLRTNSGPGATPRLPGSTPIQTPRDTYNLNRGQSIPGATPREFRAHEKTLKVDLRSRLAALPLPKETEWELELPEEQQEPGTGSMVEEDATERDRRLAVIEAARKEVEFKRQTQVIQKGLPRPKKLDLDSLYARAGMTENLIERMIDEEAVSLMANDMRKFPVPGAKVKGKGRPLRHFSDEELSRAKHLIEVESQVGLETFVSSALQFWQTRSNDTALFGIASNESDKEKLQLAQLAFQTLQDGIMKQAEKSNALEKKLGLHLGGYKKRAEILRQKSAGAHQALMKERNKFGVVNTALIVEDAGLVGRLEQLRDEVTQLAKRERQAQEEYRLARNALEDAKPARSNGIK